MIYRRVFWRNRHYMFTWGNRLEFVTEFPPPLTSARISIKENSEMIFDEVNRVVLPVPGALVVQNIKIEKRQIEEENFITVVSWNINKCYRYQHVIKMLMELKPD